ncbi:MAG: TetR/AcrR family transcriptional regulator [Haloechinothrix sp.]
MAVNSTSARVRKVAVRLFATKGFHGVGIRELAQAANLSSASLYHYMGTKETLLADIMRECLERLLSAAQLAIADVDDPVERVGRLVSLHVLAHAVQAAETAVVDNEVRSLSPAARRSVVALRDDYEALWAEAITDGCRTGIFHSDDQGVSRRALLEMCSGVARWYSPKGPLPLPALATQYTGLALRALGAQPTTPDLARCAAIVSEVWGVRVVTAAG